jgi:hypothetical protein
MLLYLYSNIIVSQDIEQYYVNDKNVRFREAPSLSGKIIRYLEENESVEYIGSKDWNDGSDYKWVNVNTAKGSGWMFGEYLSRKRSTDKRFLYVEDAGIKTKEGVIYVGTHEKDLIQMLGQPILSGYDEIHNENTFVYGQDKDLIFITYKNNQRINHITVKSSSYQLSNDIRIGMNISEVKEGNLRKYGRELTYVSSDHLKNMIRSSFYDYCSVIIDIDEKGFITEIQIGSSS